MRWKYEDILMKPMEKEELINLFTTMAKARVFEERAMELFTQGHIPGFIHVGIGQEAIAAGVCANLQQQDKICITHRGHEQVVAKGTDLKRAMAELFGKEDGFCRGKAGSLHLADASVGVIGATAIVGAGIPIATGVAFSSQYQGLDQVTVCFFGDGAANHGTFHESLNMASLWKLPIVYCCENNGWAQFTPQGLTTAVTDIATRAVAYGMPGITVDGDDVLAVFEAAREAVERARKGDGPTLLECKTYRRYGHYVGDPQKYRPAEEIEESRRIDPITKFETRLIEEKVLTPEEAERIRERIRVDIEEAVKFAETSPLPRAEEALEDVYYEGEK